MSGRTIGRREFVKGGALGAMVLGSPSRVLKSNQGATRVVPPSEQIILGFLGVGRMGLLNMRKFAEHPQFRVAAVCDVYEPHLEEACAKSEGEKYGDFRAVLERKDIDAVIVSTPDHWHPLMTVLACQSGKDVYVEKPASVAVVEGRKMVEAARRYNRVVQVGTQQRSGKHFQHAVRLVREGELGKVTSVRTWNFSNSTPEGIGNPPDSDPPADLDWNMWLGPAPKVAFNPNRFGVHPGRWSTFRYFWDYAGGMMTDWGVHLLDIVQWALNVNAPLKVSASGGKFALTDNRETPDTITATFEYPDSVCTYENRSCNGRAINQHRYGIEFYGTEGTMFLDRNGFEIIPERRQQGDRSVARMYSMKVEGSNDQNHDHIGNFLDCIRSREIPVSDIESGHFSTAACLLANISYRLGRSISWDAHKEDVVGDQEASKMLDREYRNPWELQV